MRIKVTINSVEDLNELRQLIDGILAERGAKPAEPAPKKAKKAEPATEATSITSGTVTATQQVRITPETIVAKEPARTAEEIINAAEAKEEANETAVKVMLADKIKGGKKAEVKALFEEYGVSKLSELIAKYPDKLADFAKKAEAL